MVNASDGEGTVNRPQLGEFRLTKQRQVVYDILMDKLDHPTANDVFLRVKERMPTISLATVYNCLETMTQCGLVRQVNLDREPSRYCANLKEHGHFYCNNCGDVIDVHLAQKHSPKEVLELPVGSKVESYEISIRGVCPACSQADSSRPGKKSQAGTT